MQVGDYFARCELVVSGDQRVVEIDAIAEAGTVPSHREPGTHAARILRTSTAAFMTATHDWPFSCSPLRMSMPLCRMHMHIPQGWSINAVAVAAPLTGSHACS